MNRGNKEFIKKLDSGFLVFLRILCVAAAGLAVLSLAAVTVYVLINGVGKLTPELLFGITPKHRRYFLRLSVRLSLSRYRV